MTQPLFGQTVTWDAASEAWQAAGYLQLAPGVTVSQLDAEPVDAVAGTGYGTAEPGAVYVDTTGAPDLYLNSGTALLPEWTADTGTLRSGAGAPEDGVTAGDTGDFYSDTTAYALDPTTGWYRCVDGDVDTWAAVTATVLDGEGAPVDGVLGTGFGHAGPRSMLLALSGSTPTVYVCTGTTALPTWAAVGA